MTAGRRAAQQEITADQAAQAGQQGSLARPGAHLLETACRCLMLCTLTWQPETDTRCAAGLTPGGPAVLKGTGGSTALIRTAGTDQQVLADPRPGRAAAVLNTGSAKSAPPDTQAAQTGQIGGQTAAMGGSTHAKQAPADAGAVQAGLTAGIAAGTMRCRHDKLTPADTDPAQTGLTAGQAAGSASSKHGRLTPADAHTAQPGVTLSAAACASSSALSQPCSAGRGTARACHTGSLRQSRCSAPGMSLPTGRPAAPSVQSAHVREHVRRSPCQSGTRALWALHRRGMQTRNLACPRRLLPLRRQAASVWCRQAFGKTKAGIRRDQAKHARVSLQTTCS